MTRDIDVLTSPALTHLRDRWWDAAFTEFVRDTLRPQPGEHVLEVGCGAGIAELMLGLLQPGGVRYFGVDIHRGRLRQARGAARDHGLPLDLAAADVRALPYADGTFSAAFAMGVLQHVPHASRAIAELARVMRPDGRVLLVEPDNAHRYWFSSLESGVRAYALSERFFDAWTRDTSPDVDRALGPHLPTVCREHGIDAIAIHLFPVTITRLGAPVPIIWEARRRKIAHALDRAISDATRVLGQELLAALDRYAADSETAGPAFVEMQNTMLFAMVGHRRA